MTSGTGSGVTLTVGPTPRIATFGTTRIRARTPRTIRVVARQTPTF